MKEDKQKEEDGVGDSSHRSSISSKRAFRGSGNYDKAPILSEVQIKKNKTIFDRG